LEILGLIVPPVVIEDDVIWFDSRVFDPRLAKEWLDPRPKELLLVVEERWLLDSFTSLLLERKRRTNPAGSFGNLPRFEVGVEGTGLEGTEEAVSSVSVLFCLFCRDTLLKRGLEIAPLPGEGGGVDPKILRRRLEERGGLGGHSSISCFSPEDVDPNKLRRRCLTGPPEASRCC
jgi:hypothetical protein